MSDESAMRVAIKAGADALRITHWDGNGCGTHNDLACSRCYGPSPADADEVAGDVLDAAAPILVADVYRQVAAELNGRLWIALDALANDGTRQVAIGQLLQCRDYLARADMDSRRAVSS